LTNIELAKLPLADDYSIRILSLQGNCLHASEWAKQWQDDIAKLKREIMATSDTLEATEVKLAGYRIFLTDDEKVEFLANKTGQQNPVAKEYQAWVAGGCKASDWVKRQLHRKQQKAIRHLSMVALVQNRYKMHANLHHSPIRIVVHRTGRAYRPATRSAFFAASHAGNGGGDESGESDSGGDPPKRRYYLSVTNPKTVQSHSFILSAVLPQLLCCARRKLVTA
jgi:hypothetical protein